MELTDSVMCRRLISVSSLHGSKEDALSAQGPARPAQHATGSQPRCPYASFLCFSLVLASEILLWRFLSRIFCSSFFSLEEPVGEQAGSTAGQGYVCVCVCVSVCVCVYVFLCPPHGTREYSPFPPTRSQPSPLVYLLQFLQLSHVSIQDNLPELQLSLQTQVANR